MANSVLTKKSLILTFKIGEKDGDDVLREDHYLNIKPEATPDEILTVSEALSLLTDNELVRIYCEDQNDVLA